MEVALENTIIYSAVILLCLVIVFIYLRKQKRITKSTMAKIKKAEELGLHEPVSLHPVVNSNSCIGTGACIAACPEKDILGLVNGKARPVNASRCVGHSACFNACPTEAITLCIGSEKRGVDLPHVSPTFESNIRGIYIAGELGGMGLIKNAVAQGQQAVNNLSKNLTKSKSEIYDLIIVGAGPAGISAALAAKKNKLKFLILEQDSLGGTVFNFPRKKIIMTSPMDLPLRGKVKLKETNKTELLELWKGVLNEYQISVQENTKVEGIEHKDDHFAVTSKEVKQWETQSVLLALGRRGSPRKLNVPGEVSEKVAYRLLEPEHIQDKNILVVGGGDSAIESALMLADHNQVTISYRSGVFNRIKPGNKERISEAENSGKVKILYNTTVNSIEDHRVVINTQDSDTLSLENDLVYIFAGGELPTQFLKKVGLDITKKFGEAVLEH